MLTYEGKKSRTLSYSMEWTVFIAAIFYGAPRYVLSKPNLIASGFTKEEWPILHKVLFEWHDKILVAIACLLLIYFCMRLTRPALRYQFSRFRTAIFGGVFFGAQTYACMSVYQFGAFWPFFIIGVVSTNDAFAFFCGKAFGKTKLITLSPNKTMEGFVGGAFMTFIFLFLTMGAVF